MMYYDKKVIYYDKKLEVIYYDKKVIYYDIIVAQA